MSLGGIKLAPLLTEIKVDIKNFKDDMNKAAIIGKSEADKISKQLAGVKKAGESLSKAGATLTKGVSLPLAGVGVAVTKMALDFDSSFAKVSTLLDENTTDFGKYKDDLLKGSSESKVAVDEFSEAVYGSISAGVSQEKAIGFTTDAMKLAKGGFTDGAKAVDVLTTAINGYGLVAEDSTKVSDLLITTQNLGKTTVDELSSSMGAVIPIASSVNFGIEELSASYAQLTKNGIATSEAGTYMKSMLSELGKSGSITDKTLRELTGKGFAQLKKEGIETTEILGMLSQNANENGKNLKDMFGSVEAGSAALVLMKDGGEEYNEMLDAMGKSAGATQEAFDKMDSTPAEQLKGAINELKNAGIELGADLIPIATKLAGGISNIANKFSNLTDEQQENIIKWGGLAIAAGPALSLIGGGMKTFTNISSAIGGATKAMGVMQGTTGIAGLLSGFGGATVAAAPFALALAGIGATGYALHKTLSEEVIPTVDLFEGEISEATKNAVGAYMDMDKNVATALYSQKVNMTTITDEIATEMVGKFTTMGTMIVDAEKLNHQNQLAEMTNYFAQSNALTAEEESKILGTITQKHDERVLAIQVAQDRIKEIYTKATAENRAISEAEASEINALQVEMKNVAINELTATEAEATIIRERLKEYTGRVTAEMAAEMITNANVARDGEITAAEEKYNRLIVEAANLKEAGTITKTQYDAMVKDAQKTRDDQIEAANKACEGVKKEIKNATPGIETEVNMQTGKIKTAYDTLVESLRGIFAWITESFNKAQRQASTAKGYKESLGGTVNQPKSSSGGAKPGGHESFAFNGLSYVPYDGFTVRLHEGERVLTKRENENYGNSYGSINNNFRIENMVIREEADTQKVARELYNLQQKSDRGRGLNRI